MKRVNVKYAEIVVHDEWMMITDEDFEKLGDDEENYFFELENIIDRTLNRKGQRYMDESLVVYDENGKCLDGYM